MSNKTIRLSGIVEDSIVDGPGLRMTLFTQGCQFRCEGCHNESTWPLDGGKEYELQEIQKRWRKNPLLSGITFSGGEPTLQAEQVLKLAKMAKKDGLDVMLYTGNSYFEMSERSEKAVAGLLDTVDYLIDGRFILKERSLDLKFRGSKNQRIIDMNKTRANKKLEIIE